MKGVRLRDETFVVVPFLVSLAAFSYYPFRKKKKKKPKSYISSLVWTQPLVFYTQACSRKFIPYTSIVNLDSIFSMDQFDKFHNRESMYTYVSIKRCTRIRIISYHIYFFYYYYYYYHLLFYGKKMIVWGGDYPNNSMRAMFGRLDWCMIIKQVENSCSSSQGV